MGTLTRQNFSKIHEGQVGTLLKFGPFHMEWPKTKRFMATVQGFMIKGGTRKALPHHARIFKNPTFCWIPCSCPFTNKLSPPHSFMTPGPSPYHGPHMEKKFIIAFRQFLPKSLPVVCISRSTIITHLKKLGGIKSIKKQL